MGIGSFSWIEGGIGDWARPYMSSILTISEAELVKKLDENDWPEALDHVGWRLWQATQRWKRELDDGLVAMGYPWAAEARANVIMHVGRSGIRQSELVRRMELSKQAVQQLLDELVADGIIERKLDPGTARQASSCSPRRAAGCLPMPIL